MQPAGSYITEDSPLLLFYCLHNFLRGPIHLVRFMSLEPSLSSHKEILQSGGNSYKTQNPLLWVFSSFLILHKHFLLGLRPTLNQEALMSLTLASTKMTFPNKLTLTGSIGLGFMKSLFHPGFHSHLVGHHFI